MINWKFCGKSSDFINISDMIPHILLALMLLQSISPIVCASTDFQVAHQLWKTEAGMSNSVKLGYFDMKSSSANMAEDAYSILQGQTSGKNVYYGIEIEKQGKEPIKWTSSINSCYLTQTTNMTITLNLDNDGYIYHVDFSVGPYIDSGSVNKEYVKCVDGAALVRPLRLNIVKSRMSEEVKPKLEFKALPASKRSSNTGKSSVHPADEGPEEGEKTFFQKYWLYILLGSFFLLGR